MSFKIKLQVRPETAESPLNKEVLRKVRVKSGKVEKTCTVCSTKIPIGASAFTFTRIIPTSLEKFARAYHICSDKCCEIFENQRFKGV